MTRKEDIGIRKERGMKSTCILNGYSALPYFPGSKRQLANCTQHSFAYHQIYLHLSIIYLANLENIGLGEHVNKKSFKINADART